ncbi:hypothetical protein AKO1_008642 [Acrasis kona]|uniref:Uncharacterized protein n=1 Tax=Acrasis kona TaxID=1008807 RepID=A0AAW2ZCB3_9EUKA
MTKRKRCVIIFEDPDDDIKIEEKKYNIKFEDSDEENGTESVKVDTKDEDDNLDVKFDIKNDMNSDQEIEVVAEIKRPRLNENNKKEQAMLDLISATVKWVQKSPRQDLSPSDQKYLEILDENSEKHCCFRKHSHSLLLMFKNLPQDFLTNKTSVTTYFVKRAYSFGSCVHKRYDSIDEYRGAGVIDYPDQAPPLDVLCNLVQKDKSSWRLTAYSGNYASNIGRYPYETNYENILKAEPELCNLLKNAKNMSFMDARKTMVSILKKHKAHLVTGSLLSYLLSVDFYQLGFFSKPSTLEIAKITKSNKMGSLKCLHVLGYLKSGQVTDSDVEEAYNKLLEKVKDATKEVQHLYGEEGLTAVDIEHLLCKIMRYNNLTNKIKS